MKVGALDWGKELLQFKEVVWWICRNGRQPYQVVAKWSISKLIREAMSLVKVCNKESGTGVENL